MAGRIDSGGREILGGSGRGHRWLLQGLHGVPASISQAHRVVSGVHGCGVSASTPSCPPSYWTVTLSVTLTSLSSPPNRRESRVAPWLPSPGSSRPAMEAGGLLLAVRWPPGGDSPARRLVVPRSLRFWKIQRSQTASAPVVLEKPAAASCPSARATRSLVCPVIQYGRPHAPRRGPGSMARGWGWWQGEEGRGRGLPEYPRPPELGPCHGHLAEPQESRSPVPVTQGRPPSSRPRTRSHQVGTLARRG
jgi:hypothetical protein